MSRIEIIVLTVIWGILLIALLVATIVDARQSSRSYTSGEYWASFWRGCAFMVAPVAFAYLIGSS